jgi:hypothetical protein
MSFREKTAWISVVSIAGIYGFYFWSVIRAGHPGGRVQLGGLLLGTIVALVVLQVVLTLVAWMFTPREERGPMDERERLIELRAMRSAYSGLATAVAMACFFGAMNPPIVFNTNALLFVLVTAELVRQGCKIIQYRREA